jgi:DNA helicase II / ATP-dependent DNA helicase PcrA
LNNSASNNGYINDTNNSAETETQIEPVISVDIFDTTDQGELFDEQSFEVSDELRPSRWLPEGAFQILIEENLVIKIERFGDIDKKRLNKAISDLENNHWGFGVRVKKLKGITEKVFEARLDRDRRILFQIKSVTVENIDRLYPALILLDIVRHKKISAGANKIIKMQIERLNLQTYNSQLTSEVESEKAIESIDDVQIEEDDILSKVFDLQNTSLISRENYQNTGLPNGIKYYRFDRNIRNAWIEKDQINRVLALSPFQQMIVYKDGPTLINGGAGTGKTTVLAHRFVYNWQQKNYPSFYLTLTPQLKNFVIELINRMEIKPDALKFILTFDEVCKILLMSEGDQFIPENEIGINHFLEWMKWQRSYSKYDPLQIWQEYIGIVKGTCLDYNKSVISLKEYKDKGKQVSLFPPEERDMVYKIITEYHREQKQNKKWDQIDISQYTLSLLQDKQDLDVKRKLEQISSNIKSVVCDEIQDFVTVQYAIFMLIIHPDYKSELYFGGDSQQTINSSNFRWEDLRNYIWKELKQTNPNFKLNPLKIMRRNFRSTSKMVEIANSFIEMKEALKIKDDGDYLQQGIEDQDSQHTPGSLVMEERETIIELIEKSEAKNWIIIVYGEETKDKLLELLDEKFENFIFTIAECKGLEFTSSILFNIASDSDLDWRKLMNKNARDLYTEKNHLYIDHVFNRLFVALTRSRRGLVILEDDEYAYQFWLEVREKCEYSLTHSSLDELDKLWSLSSTPAEYKINADYFFNNQKYATAADFYKNAGDMTMYNLSKAYVKRAESKFSESAKMFEELGRMEDAAKDYEKIDPLKAMGLYQELNDEKSMKRCEARIAESKGRMKAAAQLFASIQDYRNTSRIYSNIGNKKLANKYEALNYEKHKEWDKAEKTWLLGGFNIESKISKFRFFMQEKEFKSAVHLAETIAKEFYAENKLAESAKYWQRANELWINQNNLEKAKISIAYKYKCENNQIDAEKIFLEYNLFDEAISMWKEQLNHEKIAELYKIRAERENNPVYLEEAAKVFVEINSFYKALECLTDSDNWVLIGNIYSAAGEHKNAAQTYEKGNKMKLAGDEWLKIEETLNAANCYRSSKSWKKAAELYVQTNEHVKAAECYKEIKFWDQAGESYLIASEFEQSAICFENLGDWDKAVISWDKAENYEKAAIACENSKQWIKAAEYYRKLNDKPKIAISYTHGKQFDKAGDTYLELENFTQARISYERELNYRGRNLKIETRKQIQQKLIQALLALKEYHSAAQEYLKLKDHKNAIKYYRLAKDYKNVAKIYEKDRKWVYAANAWIKNKTYDNAAINFQRGKKWAEAAEYWLKHEESTISLDKSEEKTIKEKIAECYHLAEMWDEALPFWQELENIEKSAECLEKLNRFDEAIEELLKIERFERVAILLENQDKHSEAVDYYKKATKHDDAARLLEKLDKSQEAAEQWELANKWNEAIENWSLLGNKLKLAECYEKLDEWSQAVVIWEQLKEWDKAAICYEKIGDWKSAAENWEKHAHGLNSTESWERAAKAFEQNNQSHKANECWQKSNNKLQQARIFEKDEKYEDALTVYTEAGDKDKVNEMLTKLGRMEEVLENYETQENWLEAGKIHEHQKNTPKVIECYQKLENKSHLKEFFETNGYWVKLAEVYEQEKNYLEAKNNYEKAGMAEKVKEMNKLIRPKKKQNKIKRR